MTYPVDDKGNPRVDFVWGNFPLQPDDQRDTYNTENQLTNQDQNNNWTIYPTVGSATLSTGWTVLNFPTGDGGNTRQQTFTWDNHEIAQSNYENYPSFSGGYPFDDTIANVAVPDLINASSPTAAQTALENAGLVLGNSYNTTSGATAENDLYVKSQSIAPGTLVNVGTAVDITTYHYVAPVVYTTGPISGFNRTIPGDVGPWSLNGNQSIMYLVGRTVRPTIGDSITVSGSSDSSHNVIWLVSDIANNDSYNSGGTAVKVTLNSGSISQDTSSGGTWTKN